MMKLLLFPFRLVAFFLRPVFRLSWLVYLGLAIGVGSLAYQDFQTYQYIVLEAEQQIADGPPDAIPLSKWSTADNTPYNNEVTIRGLYFAALEVGEFVTVGPKRQFVLLADDQGREVKAVLVVSNDDLAQFQLQLVAQGNGDRIAVSINGTLVSNTDWRRSIRSELNTMNVPSAQDLVFVEPFLGDRATAIADRAERTFATVAIFGGLAGMLAFIGLGKLFSGEKRDKALAPGKSHKNARGATHLHETPQPVGKPQASPWGTFQPTSPPEFSPTPAAKAQSQTLARETQKDTPPPQPDFKSVFPGGGSGFRFKTTDEIILQSFGTLSTLKRPKRDN